MLEDLEFENEGGCREAVGNQEMQHFGIVELKDYEETQLKNILKLCKKSI